MDEKNRSDDKNDRKRAATNTEPDERTEDKPRRRDQTSRTEPLTRREREERWPVD
jgi:hypothetical protein